MATTLQNMKWDLHNYKLKKILAWGLKRGYITLYSDYLIEKLRTIYDGGIPASILLLSNGMANGKCYNRAFLMARAFLDDDDVDVRLIYALVDSIKLNPEYFDDNDPSYADHCVVELTFKNGAQFIVDTSRGLIYDKNLYWLMEHPKIRETKNKEDIIKQVAVEEDYCPEDIERDKYASTITLPIIEMTYGNQNEM